MPSGFPDDRESAAVNSVVKDRASFVEYIAFVLGDDYVASMLEGKQMGESGFFANSSDAMPALYEKMLKTSVEGPERIKDIVLSAPFAPYPFGRWLLSALFRKKMKKAKCARPQDADGRKGNVSSS